MRVILLLVLLVLMSITPPTLAVTATATTTTVVSSSSSSSSGSECDPSYPDVCIPSPPPDLACSDISERRFEVVGSDPHALDGDNNGIACEGPPLPVPPIPLQAQQQQQEAQEQQEQNQTETQNLPTSTTTPFITNATTKKTDGLLTASINDTRFTTDQIISIDGTLAGGDGAGAGAAGGTVFIELRDPHNQALLYDSTNMTTTGTSDTPFSYSLVAGKLLENAGGDAAGDNRRVVKPMNETGSNYTLLVGYDGGTGDVTSPSNDDITTTTSEVQFVFAYDHVLDAGEAAATTTPPASERGSPSDVTPPRQPPRVSPPAEEEDLEDEQSRLEELLEEAREDEGEDAEGRLQELLDEQEERADDDDDDDDSRDALEILKDVLNREPPRDVDEDDD
jgi:hypothetical protein